LEIQEDVANYNDQRGERDLFHNLEDDRKQNPTSDTQESNINNIREEKENGNKINKRIKNTKTIQCAKEYPVSAIIVNILIFQQFGHLFDFEKETK